MDKKNYIHILENPELISQEHALGLKDITQQYPFFQSAKALHLKNLKNQDSFKYNNELKITAAHTTDRTVLFDFITSDVFQQTPITQQPKKSFKEKILPKKTIISNDLSIGKPLAFTKNEAFSFNQWLQLSSEKTIIRKPVDKNPDGEKDAIINRFIKTSPKISRPNKAAPSDIKISENKQNNQLATETLAKVYLEQKKYDSAIKAYQILSLKYPEKSSFFADQIKRIQILQKNK